MPGPYHALMEYSLPFQLLLQPGTRGDVDGGVPVSYTHLDVYKRQLLDSATGSSLLDAANHDVTDVCVSLAGTAQYTDCLLYTSRCV